MFEHTLRQMLAKGITTIKEINSAEYGPPLLVADVLEVLETFPWMNDGSCIDDERLSTEEVIENSLKAQERYFKELREYDENSEEKPASRGTIEKWCRRLHKPKNTADKWLQYMIGQWHEAYPAMSLRDMIFLTLLDNIPIRKD